MGNYKIWQCRNCQSSIIAHEDIVWAGFSGVNSQVPCCSSPDIFWAYRPGDNHMEIPTTMELPEEESEYRVWQCKNCGTTVLAAGHKSWGGFSSVNANVVCCEMPDIEWAPPGHNNEIMLDNNDEVPDLPEPKRLSQIELALEDMNKTPLGVE